MKIPDSVAEVAAVIGRERALYLVGKVPESMIMIGGYRTKRKCLYVPRTLPLDHPLVSIIGFADATKMVRMFGGEILKLGTCSRGVSEFRDQRIRELLEMGWSRKRVAAHVGIPLGNLKNALRSKPKEAQRS